MAKVVPLFKVAELDIMTIKAFPEKGRCWTWE